MTLVARWLGALLLALLSPGLLLPGGLDFSVCTCAQMSAATASPSEAKSCCFQTCCETRDQRGPAVSESRDCCASCRTFTTQRRDSSTPAQASPDSLVAARTFAAGVVIPWVDAPVSKLAPRPASRAAPPLCERALPLRI